MISTAVVAADRISGVVISAAGAISGDLSALRGLLRETQQIVRYEPRGDAAAWQAVERRLEA